MTADELEGMTAEAPASTGEAGSAYVDQVVIGYLLYGVGAVTAFVAAALTLSDAEAALHSSLLAIGLLGAGLAGDRIDTLIGAKRANVLAYVLLAIASICIATAPAYAVTLAGAGMVGVSVGLLLAHVNRALTRGGGALAQVRMSRAALVAMVGSISVPIVIGLGENSGLGWQLAFVVAGGLIVVGLLGTRWRQDGRVVAVRHVGRLTKGYWLAWWLLVLVVSVEFAIVFWASTLVERQVGVSLADATLVAASFYAGMAASRFGLSFAAVGGRDPMMLMRLGLALALAGSLLAWSASGVVGRRPGHLPWRRRRRVPVPAVRIGRAGARARPAGQGLGAAHPGLGCGHPRRTLRAGRRGRRRRRLDCLAADPGRGRGSSRC